MMELLRLGVELLVIGFVVFIPVIWIWVLYHKIKCRKVEVCTDKKCRYFDWCEHNHDERKKEEMELRRWLLMEKGDMSDAPQKGEEGKG